MSKALKAAIEANDPEAVQKALKGVKDVNRKIPGVGKPLIYACEKGADKVLEALFRTGAVGEKGKSLSGEIPFAVAAEHGKTEVMEKLWSLKQASPQSVTLALDLALMKGREEVARFIVERFKPPIDAARFRLAVRTEKKSFIELLVNNGGDINAKDDISAEKQITTFHAAAYNGNVVRMRILAECGARVNERSATGKTPLMMLASQLESHESRESTEWALKGLETCLSLGADAKAKDNYGNDAIDYCAFAYNKAQPTPAFLGRLRVAGAEGDEATRRLFVALRDNDLAGAKQAIEDGADVNRVCPSESTPLMWTLRDGSGEFTELLLKAGADPNKAAANHAPLTDAARGGNLELVKRLIAAGADIHAVRQSGEYLENAHSAAEMNRKHDVADHLKSLGAGQPKLASSRRLEPGVKSWNDFSEILVKGTVEKAAQAVAGIISGKVQLGVYGQLLMPGEKAYVVIRPVGMNWCNVFRVMPPRQRFEDSEKAEAFARELAKASSAAVLSIEYSDTAGAASVFRAEPDGKSSRDAGWDFAMLQEVVENMPEEAPANMKEQLAKMSEDDPTSEQRLEALAERERFVVAAYDFYCEPGRKLDVDLAGYGADAFDGVAFVTR